MPLPWKKTKPNRISRIVADLQPPSRPASLVVETGFPTSVVDLFVKNRDRIKKHSLKKNKHKHSPFHVAESAAPLSTPSVTFHHSPPLPVDEAVVIAAAATCSTGGHGMDDLEEKSSVADVELDVVGGGCRANGDENANANFAVFVLAAKMFLAVVPVLSTKKLALGISLSAFLLFLLEILGKFSARFFNPSSIQNRFFSSTNAECHRVGFIDRGGEEQQQQEFPPINSASNNEIQIVESNSDHEQLALGGGGLQREPFRNREKGKGCSSELEAENEEEKKMEMGKNQRSRSSKLKAKIIKKLIPKKLRSGKRLKTNKNEKNKRKQEGGIIIMENEQGAAEWSCEEEEHEAWELQQTWEPEEEEEEEEEEELGSSSTMGKGAEEEDNERKKNLECKFVIMMILVGLCGGRFLALVLTVSGCFIFKFIKSVHRN